VTGGVHEHKCGVVTVRFSYAVEGSARSSRVSADYRAGPPMKGKKKVPP
jgi:hypothetical protein